MRPLLVALAGTLFLTSCGERASLLFPPVVELERVSPSMQSGTAGEAVLEPPAVRALDGRGNPVPGYVIGFEITEGGGRVDRRLTVTDDGGVAALQSWILGEAAGANRVVALTHDREMNQLDFRVDGRPGAPAILHSWLPNLLEAPAGSPLPIALVVFVRDRFENLIAGVPVRFELEEGAGSLARSQATTNNQGFASAGQWRLGTTTGRQTAIAHVEGLEPFAIEATALPGPLASLELLQAPISVVEAGQLLVGAVLLELRDEFGNPAPGMTVQTRVLQGGGTVLPEKGETDPDGRYLLDRWELGPRTGRNALELTVPGLTPIEVEVTTGPAAPGRLDLLQGHGQAAAPGATLPTAPAVRVVDRFGNPVPGRTVTFAVVAGRGSLGQSSAESDVEGRAEGGAWTLGDEAGVHAIEARLEGEEAVPAFRFEAESVPGEILRLDVVAGSGQSHAAGYPLPERPAVRVHDGEGTPVSGVPVFFEVQAGGGEATPGETTTDAAGIARAGSWILGPEPGPNLLLVRARDAESVTLAAEGIVPFHLDVAAVHLNQANQTITGAIPAVAGRSGAVRIFPRATAANDIRTRARVTLFHGTTPVLEEVVDRSGSVETGIPTGLEPETVASSFNLPIPAELVRPGLGIRVELDPGEEVDVPDRDRLVFPGPDQIHPFDVRTLPTFAITFVPIHSTELGTIGRIDGTNFEPFLEATRTMLPVAELDVRVRNVYSSSARPLTGLSAPHGWALLVQEIQALLTLEAPGRYYHGIIQAEGTAAPLVGIAYRPPEPESPLRSAISHDEFPQAPITVAHEFGHNLGQRHAPCGNAGGVDPGFPYAGAVLETPGYDVREGLFREAQEHRDLMSYCFPAWISDYNYQRLVSWREAVAGSAPPSMVVALGTEGAGGGATGGGGATATGGVAETDGVLLWGGWSREGPELNPVFHLRAAPTPPSAGGEAEIRGLAADGTVLFQRTVQGVELGHEVDETLRHFSIFLPLPAADREALRRIVLSTPSGELERVVGPVVGAGPDPGLSTAPLGTDRALVEWNAEVYPVALVRDAREGTILSFARNGRVEVSLPASRVLDVQLGEGIRVQSREVRVRVDP